MSVLSAVDACPGLLALHEAKDGFVARIRLPGGYVSAARWRALAAVADRFGDGRLDLTARGNVQLRGIRTADADALGRAAAAAGLLPSAAHDRARNIMASPLAGLGGRPPLRRLVRELDAALLREPGLAALPGRFLFALDDGSGGSGLAGCDIGLVRSAAGAAELVVAGRRVGVQGEVDAAVPLVVAGRGVGVRCGMDPAVPLVVAVATAAIASGVGRGVSRIAELADGGEAVAASVGGSLAAAAQNRPDRRLPLGPSGSGRALVIAAPLGRLTSAQALLVADLLQPGEVARIAIAGRLVVPVRAGVADAAGRLVCAGLLVADDNPLAGVTACSGASCARSAADVRAAARPLDGHPRTHWAGCARRCGCPPDAEPVIAVGADSYLLPGAVEPLQLAAPDGPLPA
jgi:precorrin-3B synthase